MSARLTESTSQRRAVRRGLVRLAGSPGRAAAVEAVLDGRDADAEPNDDDQIAARQWHEDADAAGEVDYRAVVADALKAIENLDVLGAVRVLREGLPPRLLAPLAELIRQVGRRKRRAA